MSSMRSAFPRYGAVVLLAATICSSTAYLLAQKGTAQDFQRIVFQHEGKNISGFVLYLEPQTGATVRLDLGPLVPDAKGQYSALLPAVPPGTYKVEIAAYNSAGESPRVPADPATLKVSAPAAMSGHSHEGVVSPPPARQASEPPKTTQSDNDAKKQSDPKKDGDAKKDGVGKKFWKVLVGDDDKP